jgi:hypothetical protein
LARHEACERARIRMPTARYLFGLALAFSFAACSSSGAHEDAAVDPCPSVAPADGTACASTNQRCVYAHCATEGVVAALCQAAGDGGTATWSATTTPCTACGGTTTCMGDDVCADRIGGAVISMCMPHTCGTGPLDCACACGAGVTCTIYGAPASDGALVGCNFGCGASVCP